MAENENPIISLKVDASAHSRFEALSSNEERRQFVLEEFKRGVFSDVSHIDYFIEQYAKGEFVIKDENKAKIGALAQGIEGYKGLEQISADLSQRLVDASLHYTTTSYMGGGAESMDDPNLLRVETTDLGLSQLIENDRKAKNKDALKSLLIDVQKRVKEDRLIGTGNRANNDDLLKQLDELPKSKWYQFGRDRKIAKAKGKLGLHWENKAYHASWYNSWYYKLQNRFSGNPSRDRDIAYHAKRRFEKAVGLAETVASTRWLSKDFGKKLKASTELLWLRVTGRGINRQMNKFVKHANNEMLNNVIKDMDDRLKNLSKKEVTELQRRGNERLAELYNRIISKSQDRVEANKEAYEQASTGLEALRPSTVELKDADKYREKLEKLARELNEQRDKDLAKHPLLKALNVAGLQDKAKAKITAETILDNIIKDRPEAEKASLKKQLGFGTPESNQEPERQEGREEERVEDMPERQETPEPKKPIVTEADEELPNPVITEDREDDKPVVIGGESHTHGSNSSFELDGYEKKKDGSYRDDKGNTVELNVSEDKKRYDLVTKDENAQSREPKDNEIQALVAKLKEDGHKQVLLDLNSLNKETVVKFVAELDKQKIDIKNRDKVESYLPQRQEEREPVVIGGERNPKSENSNGGSGDRTQQPNLQQIKKYYDGLHLRDGQKPEVKLKDLNPQERKIVEQIRNARNYQRRLVKEGKIDEKDLDKRLSEATTRILSGVISGKNKPLKKEIKDVVTSVKQSTKRYSSGGRNS